MQKTGKKKKKNYRNKDIKKGNPKGLKSPIYRKPKPQGSQKTGRLGVHLKATRRLIHGLGESDPYLIPQVTCVPKTLKRFEETPNLSTSVRTQVHRLKGALQGPFSMCQSTCHLPLILPGQWWQHPKFSIRTMRLDNKHNRTP